MGITIHFVCSKWSTNTLQKQINNTFNKTLETYLICLFSTLGWSLYGLVSSSALSDLHSGLTNWQIPSAFLSLHCIISSSWPSPSSSSSSPLTISSSLYAPSEALQKQIHRSLHYKSGKSIKNIPQKYQKHLTHMSKNRCINTLLWCFGLVLLRVQQEI